MLETCAACGLPLETEAGFCSNCGRPVGRTAPLQSLQTPVYAGPAPFYYRPPRNPRQMAAFAAGTMIMVAGIFALIFGNIIIYWDAVYTDWDWETDEETTVIDTGPLVAGILCLAAFAISMVSAYHSFRMMRWQLAIMGPLALIVAYFSVILDEPFILIVFVEVLILAAISLALLYHALPRFHPAR